MFNAGDAESSIPEPSKRTMSAWFAFLFNYSTIK